MSRFSQIEDPAGNKDLENLYQDMLANGFGEDVPINWLTSQSTRTDILAGTWAFSKGMLLEGELPMMLKQMIAEVIAVRNDCNYCRALHGNTLSMLGVPKNIIHSCVNDPELGEVQQPHKAILLFAVKVARNPSQVCAEDMQELRRYGISDEEMLEIIAMGAYCNFINTWADLSNISLDGEAR